MVLLASMLTVSQISFSQPTVKELDKSNGEQIKGKLTRIKLGKGLDRVVIFFYKSDKRLYSVQKNEKLDSYSSPETYQFAFINDTLLRAYYFKLDSRLKKHVIAIKYLTGEITIALSVKGDLPFPANSILIEKSIAYRKFAQEIINSTN